MLVSLYHVGQKMSIGLRKWESIIHGENVKIDKNKNKRLYDLRTDDDFWFCYNNSTI